MDFTNLNKDKAISYHLSLLKDIDPKLTVFSSLVALLRDTRKITGRNLLNGEKNSNEEDDFSDSWLGALGYLTILDQLGKCYRPTSISKINQGNSITRALKYFTKLDEDRINAIYALRCALAHDYSLFNIGKKGKDDKLTHHFTATGIGHEEFIRLPLVKWDCNHANKNEFNVTIINLPQLGDFVEHIYFTIRGLAIEKQLSIELEGGHIELKNRYLMFISRSQNNS